MFGDWDRRSAFSFTFAVALMFFNGSLAFADSGLKLAPSFFLYQTYLRQQIEDAWIQPAGIDGSAVVSFHISTDGEVSNVRLDKSSGNAKLDESCLKAVRDLQRLKPPPAEVYNDFKEVRLTFVPDKAEDSTPEETNNRK